MATLDLVDMTMIAQRAGVARPVVTNWRVRSQGTDQPFPEPYLELVIGKIWLWRDVLKWLKATRRGHYVTEVLAENEAWAQGDG